MTQPNHDIQTQPKLNEIFDILIAGGGPAGTAVAFRGHELGMRTLVIEYDDLMKRIRDYSKSKLILPDFGGGDKVKFPKGGALVDALQFGPIDKDAMCLQWKALYEKSSVVKRIGFELTGLNRRSDGCYEVTCWDHNLHSEHVFLAKNVVLALGNGVPRRLDIPGDTEGIAFRLRDPHLYVGEPACVIGGGTSAAEAVIDISNAKVRAGDATSVYWSYRGDRLPRVSKALAAVFFEAYAGNGNIRYFPKSEPAAIVTRGDQQSYLSIRVDRRYMDGRPVETTHLEFAKKNCLACIGEDLPEGLLNALGISLVRGGPRHKKRVVVNAYLESCLPGVFMVGDLLSQAYLQAHDFGADPTTFEEVKHRGNIKTALRDGVLVAEVIKQRLDGKTEIQVKLEDAKNQVVTSELTTAADSSQAADRTLKQNLPPVAVHTDKVAVLHQLLPSGVIESEHSLKPEGLTQIGRERGDIVFRDDPLLSETHAWVEQENDGFILGSSDPNADIFLVMPPAEKRGLAHGDLLRVGCQFLLISKDTSRAWVNHYNREGQEVGSHFLSEKPLVFGRESPDITLDEHDMSLSRRHLTLTLENGQVILKDLKSANHSFLRLRKPTAIKNGDRFQLGSKLFEIAIAGSKRHVPLPPIPQPTTPSATTGQHTPSIRFKGVDGVFSVNPGQTICDVAEANGIAIKAECHMGVCGSDPIEIVSGAEYLVSDVDPGEAETLEDICDLEPGPCRLACKARVKGPVEVKLLQV